MADLETRVERIEAALSDLLNSLPYVGAEEAQRALAILNPPDAATPDPSAYLQPAAEEAQPTEAE